MSENKVKNCNIRFYGNHQTLSDENKMRYGDIVIGEVTVAETSYESGELVVATVNVVQFGAWGDGCTDDRVAFCQAMEQCVSRGGGTVFVPQGIYYLSGALTIPKGVVLRGEFEPKKHLHGGGTVIITDYDIPTDSSFIIMESSSAIKNIAIYHCNQNFSQPSAMGATIGFATQNTFMVTVENTMLYNPYTAFDFATLHNGHLTLNNVYASPLYVGIISDQSSDVNRLYNVFFGPEYYINCALEGAPITERDKDALVAHMRDKATGFIVERNDALQLYNVSVNDMHTGIICRETTNPNNTSWRGLGGYSLYGFSIKNCKIGLKYEGVNYGGAITVNGEIQPLGEDAVGIYITPAFTTNLFFNGINIGGEPAYGLKNQGSGNINMINCSFKGWKVGNAAVKSTDGALFIQQCNFGQKSCEIDAAGVKTLAVHGCSFQSEHPDINTQGIDPKSISILHEPLALPSAPKEMYLDIGKIPSASCCRIYNVIDFIGENRDADDHGIYIQKALNTAGDNGGGIVYLPPGRYNLRTQLSVPTGVELRGAGDYYTSLVQIYLTFINVYVGKGSDEGAIITLSEKSGIRGLAFNFPEQNTNENYYRYPWLVQSRGKEVWAMDLDMVNAWQGIDFGSYQSDGFYISNIIGQSLKTGIFAGNNSTVGRIENCHMTCAEWTYSGLPNKPVLDPGYYDNRGIGENTWTYYLRSLMEFNDVMVLGYNEKLLLLGNASYGSRRGLRYVEQDGKSTVSACHFMHYIDGSRNALTVEKAGNLRFYTPVFCCGFSEYEMNYIILDEKCDAVVDIYNGFGHASNDTSYIVDGGTLNCTQMGLFSFGDPVAKVTDGSINLFSGMIYFKSGVHVQALGGKTCLKGNIYYADCIDNSKDAAVIDLQGGETLVKGNVQTHKDPGIARY